MAKNKGKGKSRRRIRNWDTRLQDGEADNAAPAKQSLSSSRAVKIPAHRLDTPETNLDDLPKATGMVVGFFPGGTIVRNAEGELLCGIAKTFRAVENSSILAVGDQVTVALTQHADGNVTDKDRADGFVIAREPRDTLLARPQPTSGKRQDIYKVETFQRVIAANMDQLVVVSSMRQPKVKPGLIDRFMIVAERGELQPLLVINKIDLAKPDEALLQHIAEIEMPTVFCSAETGEGVDEFQAKLAGHKSVLAGLSGVGKSTLINAIIPEANALTREVRGKDQRGRHTTSAAVVYDLACGGVIIDTPGIRELGMDLTEQELPWYFPEFEPFVGDCKFNDCTHTHEPHCAIIDAVEAGQISDRRYDSYLRILESL
jgi:ribosome biogenesis GTPase / thiamine phosphate phosphatase